MGRKKIAFYYALAIIAAVLLYCSFNKKIFMPSDINRLDADGATRLLHAVHSGNLLEAKTLLDQGADVKCSTGISGNSLNVAASEGNTEMILLLLQSGAWVNEKSGFFQRTPIIQAAIDGQTEAVKILIRNGADVNIQSMTGSTALHHAIFYGELEIVKLLVSSGSRLDIKNEGGETALDLAIQTCDRIKQGEETPAQQARLSRQNDINDYLQRINNRGKQTNAMSEQR